MLCELIIYRHSISSKVYSMGPIILKTVNIYNTIISLSRNTGYVRTAKLGHEFCLISFLFFYFLFLELGLESSDIIIELLHSSYITWYGHSNSHKEYGRRFESNTVGLIHGHLG